MWGHGLCNNAIPKFHSAAARNCHSHCQRLGPLICLATGIPCSMFGPLASGSCESFATVRLTRTPKPPSSLAACFAPRRVPRFPVAPRRGTGRSSHRHSQTVRRASRLNGTWRPMALLRLSESGTWARDGSRADVRSIVGTLSSTTASTARSSGRWLRERGRRLGGIESSKGSSTSTVVAWKYRPSLDFRCLPSRRSGTRSRPDSHIGGHNWLQLPVEHSRENDMLTTPGSQLCSIAIWPRNLEAPPRSSEHAATLGSHLLVGHQAPLPYAGLRNAPSKASYKRRTYERSCRLGTRERTLPNMDGRRLEVFGTDLTPARTSAFENM